MHGGLQGQVSKKENPQMEKRIQKLISKMTLKEKTGIVFKFLYREYLV